jgi:hypothetical protein
MRLRFIYSWRTTIRRPLRTVRADIHPLPMKKNVRSLTGRMGGARPACPEPVEGLGRPLAFSERNLLRHPSRTVHRNANPGDDRHRALSRDSLLRLPIRHRTYGAPLAIQASVVCHSGAHVRHGIGTFNRSFFANPARRYGMELAFLNANSHAGRPEIRRLPNTRSSMWK